MTLKCDRRPVSYLGGIHNYPIMRSMSKENLREKAKRFRCNQSDDDQLDRKRFDSILNSFLP